MKPWERYGGTTEGSKPWERYGAPKEEEQASTQSSGEFWSGAAMDLGESVLGIGDEAGAAAMSVSDLFSEGEWNWDQNLEEARKTLDTFEEENPVFSGAITGVGVAGSLLIPGATALKVASTGSKLAKAGKTAGLVGAEGAAYGALAGREEGRIQGALLGASLGAAGGVVAAKVTDHLAVRADKMAASELAEEGKELMSSATANATKGEWTDRTQEGWSKGWASVATGVSDSISRQISPEIGGRVQRFDETAARINTQDTKKYIENPAMTRVLELEANDLDFKGALLDFARHSGDTTKLTSYVKKALGDEEATALAQYLRWSMNSNRNYNKRLGNNMDPTGYMHTQKVNGIPGEAPLAPKQGVGGDFADDIVNMPQDIAEKDLVRGLYSKGEVNPADYDSVLLTNSSRIMNNNRLLQAQEKFNIKDINGGAQGLMDELEKTFINKGISAAGSRDARNSIVSLVKGQNTSPHLALKTMQNLGYSVLGGPKTAILNFADIPIAAWNNGLASAKSLFSGRVAAGADVERLGIDSQGVGEFVQRYRHGSKQKGFGGRAHDLSQALTDKTLKWGGFQWADRAAKNQTLKMIASNTRDLAASNRLSERWGAYFDGNDLRMLEKGINDAGGDITKMDKATAALYDEVLTLGLGQQQLISAAGRPEKWLNNPNARSLWMMRGFAIKHNHMMSEKVHRNWKAGNKAEAMKHAAGYVMLPGSSYAGMNVVRNELFKEDYEASGEEFMWSLADSVLGPMALNSIGLGSSFGRNEFDRDPTHALAESLLPPLGVGGDIANGVYQAAVTGDPEELGKIVTSQPIFKQWEAFINK